jgi:Mn-dependent DtxR family transcriptional regulator
MLWRAEDERAGTVPVPRHATLIRPAAPAIVAIARRRGLIETGPAPDAPPRLTDRGRAEAIELIRRHRRWEHYLVEEAGFAVDHVHAVAERLEHVPIEPEIDSDADPHGRPIPKAP